MSKHIRRPLAVLMVSVLLAALAALPTMAMPVDCPGYGNDCFGTSFADTICDGPGTDYIYGGKGNDYIYADCYYYDYVHGGKGNDYIYAIDDDDSGYYDYVYGDRGYDRCYVDIYDYYYGCEEVYYSY